MSRFSLFAPIADVASPSTLQHLNPLRRLKNTLNCLSRLPKTTRKEFPETMDQLSTTPKMLNSLRKLKNDSSRRRDTTLKRTSPRPSQSRKLERQSRRVSSRLIFVVILLPLLLSHSRSLALTALAFCRSGALSTSSHRLHDYDFPVVCGLFRLRLLFSQGSSPFRLPSFYRLSCSLLLLRSGIPGLVSTQFCVVKLIDKNNRRNVSN